LTQELRALQRYQPPHPQPQARSDSAELSYADQQNINWINCKE
jgi:hypothetical protein